MLREEINSQLKASLRGGDGLRLSVFRMLSAAIHNREIEQRTRAGSSGPGLLTDEDIMQVIRAELKKRRDAIEAYRRAGRDRQVEQESAEADMLSVLLPAELSDAELAALVAEGRALLGVADGKSFGTLMGWVMGRVKGRASGDRVASAVKRAFENV